MKHAFMTLLCAGALALTGATAMSAPVPTLKGAHKAMDRAKSVKSRRKKPASNATDRAKPSKSSPRT